MPRERAADVRGGCGAAKVSSLGPRRPSAPQAFAAPFAYDSRFLPVVAPANLAAHSSSQNPLERGVPLRAGPA